ncbi:ABC-F family ATP-binding cassette domain-containing protein [Corynebacterium hylobatis]|uniref:ABC-F family ATP-binding cassette domain-containing protein n=1 Tax=Corynebacterium hylobatis TaxID=1859290 RepID=A0A3S0BFV5_9CORY|nr:ABC-F family ATP-binding cassette domain-containing protein [Corynebacterium hylobatis]RSZ62742.1 ABC-F family ATP-binding cassette domain-containing protein [Corynebacterium hylobatis]
MASPHHLKFDGVSFTYPGSVDRVLTDITFAVPAGHVTGLIGENGAGKSTLLELVAGKLEPDVGSITTPPTTGFIEQETSLPFSAAAAELIDAAVAELRDIEQQIGDLSARLADEPELAEAFDAALATAEQSGVWELDSRIATVLAGLGLAEVPLETRLGDMSGGQRRRFALAALLLRPVDALVLDEPTNHLDDDGVDFLISELDEFRGPVLVASHDRFFLDKAADSLVDLDPGLGHEGGGGEETRQGTVFTGAFTDYLEAREDIRRRWEELYTVQEHERVRLQKATEQGAEDIFHRETSKSETRASEKFFADRAAKTLGNRLRSARSRLEALEREELPPPPARLKFHGIPEHTSLASLGEPAVVAKDLVVADRLGPLTVTVQPGDHWLIEGPNGAGKSTLLKVVQGELEVGDGLLRIPEGVRITRLSQDDEWIDLDTPAEEIFAAKVPPKSPTLVEMGLMNEETAARPLGELSLGQRRRVSLGIILASPPDILLLDEPTNHLSLALAEELEEALENYPGTVLLATHDRWIRRRWAVRTNGRGKVLSLPGRDG